MDKKCCTCGAHLRVVVVSLYDVEPDTGKFVLGEDCLLKFKVPPYDGAGPTEIRVATGSHVLCSQDPKHYTGWEFVAGELREITPENVED